MDTVYNISVTPLRLTQPVCAKIEQAFLHCNSAFVDAIREWYRDKPDSFFDGPDHPAGKARAYMRGVIIGWMAGDSTTDALHAIFKGANPDGVAYGLRLHQLGGTIRPTNKLALAIPVAPSAHGLRPFEFEQSLHRKLFLIKKHTEPEKIGTLAWSDASGVHAAYVLRKSVHIPPLKERRGYDALPSDAELASMAREVLTDWLGEELKRQGV